MNEVPLPIVYADKSNNTGENLLDLDQPVFSVAGIHLEDPTAQSFFGQVVTSLQARVGEPKYSLLRKRPRSRAALVDVLRALPADSVRTHFTDKKFMIVAKIIDPG